MGILCDASKKLINDYTGYGNDNVFRKEYA